MVREPPAVRFQAEYSNAIWHFDMSPSDLKQLKTPSWIDPDRHGAPTLMLFSVVDDRSGVAYQEYRCVYGEDAEAALKFLFNAMVAKPDETQPFQWIPATLYLDNGPVAKSAVFKRVMDSLGVEVIPHMPAGSDGTRTMARSKGKVERPFRTVKRERDLQELFRKVKKPVALFIDDAHDLHSKTPTALKRLIEIVTEGGGLISIILIGHPKLKNDLRRPKMKEIGDRTTVFEFGGLRDRQRDYIDWVLRAALNEGTEPDMVITDEAATLLAAKLKNPLQIGQHLVRAFESGFEAGANRLTSIERSISPPFPNDSVFEPVIGKMSMIENDPLDGRLDFLTRQMKYGKPMGQKEKKSRIIRQNVIF